MHVILACVVIGSSIAAMLVAISRIRGALGRRLTFALTTAGVAAALLMWWLVVRPPFPSFPMKVSVDLTVEGQRVQIERTVTCKYESFGLGSLERLTVVSPEPPSFGLRTESGGAVIIPVPAACERGRFNAREERDGKVFDPLPEKYVPLIFWTPDAADPAILEAFVTPEAIFGEHARVRLHSISIGPSEKVLADRDEFAWLDPGEYSEPDKIEYTALFTEVVSKEKWEPTKGGAAIATAIQERSNNPSGAPSVIVISGLRTTVDYYASPFTALQNELSHGAYGLGLSVGDNPQPGANSNDNNIAIDAVQPLVWTTDGLVLGSNLSQGLTLYRTSPKPYLPEQVSAVIDATRIEGVFTRGALPNHPIVADADRETVRLFGLIHFAISSK